MYISIDLIAKQHERKSLLKHPNRAFITLTLTLNCCLESEEQNNLKDVYFQSSSV